MKDNEVKKDEVTTVTENNEKQEPQNTEPEKNQEPKKEESKTEPEKKIESEKADVDVEALKKELAEANAKAKEVEALSGTIEAMKKDSENKDAVIKEYEDLVGKLIETKMEQIPADFRDLIPDNLDLKQKLNWLEKAESKGLFTKEEKKKPSVEIGKPMNVENQQIDTSKLTGSQLLKMAYSSIKK